MLWLLIIIVVCLILSLPVASVNFALNRDKIKGAVGERGVARKLAELGGEYRVWNDVLLCRDNYSSQIDHVVLSPYGIFVIETKNYQGWIFGSVAQEHWTQNIWGKRYTFFNPIKQNRGHIVALNQILPYFSDKQYVSVVVFSDNARLKSIYPPQCNVINASSLAETIKSYKGVCLTPDQVQTIALKIDEFNVVDKAHREAHLSKVRNTVTEHQQKVESGVCPRCGGRLVERNGRYGSFLGCSNYPKCKYILKS